MSDTTTTPAPTDAEVAKAEATLMARSAAEAEAKALFEKPYTDFITSKALSDMITKVDNLIKTYQDDPDELRASKLRALQSGLRLFK